MECVSHSRAGQLLASSTRNKRGAHGRCRTPGQLDSSTQLLAGRALEQLCGATLTRPPASLLGRRVQASAAVFQEPALTSPEVALLLQQGAAVTVQGSMQTPLAADTVYAVLTDYLRTPQIYSNIEGVQLHMRNGRKELIQDCRWDFLFLHGTFRTVLAVREDAVGRSVTFNLAQAGFLRDFEGRWQVTPRPGGGCLVEHLLRVEPRLAPPAALAGYTQKIFLRQVEALMQDLAAELARQQLRPQQQQQQHALQPLP